MFLQLDVGASLYRVMYVQESFSGLKNLILKGRPMSDITTSLEVNPGPVFNLHKCDVETHSLQCTNTENGLYSEAEDILCPTVQLLK